MALVNQAIDKQLTALSGVSRPLTAAEVEPLTALGLMPNQAIHDALQNLATAIAAELDKFTGVEAQAAMDVGDELIHQEFRKGDGSNAVAAVKELVGKAKELTGQIKDYAG
jgi:hypothetical protein